MCNASRDNGLLICLSITEAPPAPDDTAIADNKRRITGSPMTPGLDTFLCIGLDFSECSATSMRRELSLFQDCWITGIPAKRAEWLAVTVQLGGQMACHLHQLSEYQDETISGLSSRLEFQVYLQRSIDVALYQKQSLGLLLLNPDHFEIINHRFGREQGDSSIREISERLCSSVRRSDRVFHYGGVVFAIVLPGATARTAEITAEKLKDELTLKPILQGAVRLTFSVGVAVFQPDTAGDVQHNANELLHRADSALNIAKLAGGARSVLWKPDDTPEAIGGIDPLTGIFTADTKRDYRNMLLLWDTIGVISTSKEGEEIAQQIVDRIGATFRSDRIGLFVDDELGEPRFMAGNCWCNDLRTERESIKVFNLEAKDQQVIIQCRDKCKSVVSIDEDAVSRYVIPLISQERYLGCVYLDGASDLLSLDTSDLVFLNALASQVAIALDRAELAHRWIDEKERESQILREEVRELRKAIQHAKLVYVSEAMNQVLRNMQKVADTDVTVLITGESGTGKELLSRAIHEFSSRRSNPLVVVDCAAIAHSLLEAALFGHIKGAYTGAESAQQGYIVQAEGGTLFLDEIAELPLDVQSKLLRFVQEKEITAVGSSKTHKVDVRIVAATNRDLKEEVSKGRFREDLYYRLQIVTIVSPSLRDRTDDILPLAHYFLEKFGIQYSKGVLHLQPSAQTTLLQYDWPGNVRELQNVILRAVLMTESDQISTESLLLDDADQIAPKIEATSIASDRDTSDNLNSTQPSNPSSPWGGLQNSIQTQLDLVLQDQAVPVPVGQWLVEDLILAADVTVGGVARRGAAILNMAETTYRRQVTKIKRESRTGLNRRIPSWTEMAPAIARVIESNETDKSVNITRRARQMVLDEVLARAKDDISLGSVLMGVTLPTYKNWIEQRRARLD